MSMHTAMESRDDGTVAMGEVRHGVPVAALATTGAIGIAWFIASVALLHLIRRDLDPASHMISEYARGPHGWIQTTNFVVVGIGSAALALGLWRAVTGTAGRIGAALTGIWAIGTFASAIFPTDPAGAPATTTGHIHDSVGVGAFLIAIATAFTFAWAFRRDPAWRPFARPTLAWAIVAGASFFLVPILGSSGQGIGQRIFLAVVLSWLLATALRLRSVAARMA